MSPRCCLLLLFATNAAVGEVKHATPETYRRLLTTLQPGDTLRLEAGVYERGLPVTGCNGTPDAWITIEGPETGVAEIRQTQVANCVELRDCSHVALKRLSILGEGPEGTPGLFGISAKGGPENRVHHILIEDCVISDWNTSQQAVGISTKTPTWDWTIRRNVIRNCGTGLYLGNSNGADPFVRGLVEHNLVENPIGYCMEIKFQNPRPAIPGMPESDSRTILRHNVFSKDGTPSPDGDRPNVLVGGFPESGPGSGDIYEIHGNVFWNNPREALLQASGRVSIHDNLFLGDRGTLKAAIALRDHDLPLRRAHVYHNTIVSSGEGIRVAAKNAGDLIITGNAVFTGKDALILNGADGRVESNLTGTESDAAKHLANPAAMAFHPLTGAVKGPPLDLTPFRSDTAPSLDFDGRDKGESRHRGAFSNPDPQGRWTIERGIKPALLR
jgi:hypothetical protein